LLCSLRAFLRLFELVSNYVPFSHNFEVLEVINEELRVIEKD
jgi:hypothetical protein